MGATLHATVPSTLPTDDRHPYRTGAWRPQRHEWDADDLPVEGELPTDLAGVFASVGAQEWVVDGRDTDAPQAVRRMMELFEQRETLKPILALRVAEAQAHLRKVFAGLLDNYNSSRQPESKLPSPTSVLDSPVGCP